MTVDEMKARVTAAGLRWVEPTTERTETLHGTRIRYRVDGRELVHLDVATICILSCDVDGVGGVIAFPDGQQVRVHDRLFVGTFTERHWKSRWLWLLTGEPLPCRRWTRSRETKMRRRLNRAARAGRLEPWAKQGLWAAWRGGLRL